MYKRQQQRLGKRPTDVVGYQEAATYLHLVFPVTPFGFVTVIGGDGDKPLLPELLVALGDGLDKVTGELVDMPHCLLVLLGVRPETVSGVVDPLEVDDGGVRALVQQMPGGPRRHLLISPVDALGKVGAEELVLSGALLVHPLVNDRAGPCLLYTSPSPRD